MRHIYLILIFLQITLSVILDFTGTYAKSFGQVYISDDAFLAAAATVQNIMNGTARFHTTNTGPISDSAVLGNQAWETWETKPGKKCHCKRSDLMIFSKKDTSLDQETVTVARLSL